MLNFVDWLESTWRQTGFEVTLAQIMHGTLSEWLQLLSDLPFVEPNSIEIGDVVAVGDSRESIDLQLVKKVAQELIPWRKGPFSLFGIEIDAEWRCNLKWDRFGHLIDWRDKRVFDVGSGNGYFGYRMLQEGAQSVIGVDGHLPYVIQAAFLQWFFQHPNTVLPLRIDQYSNEMKFDVVVSMGVLYHQRNPDQHLLDLKNACVEGGTIVLETLYADADLVPQETYAGMKNVWLVPSITTIQNKLEALEFENIRLIDQSTTQLTEQRPTQWMPFRSLGEALDPASHSMTIEGYSAPQRAIFFAEKRS